MDTKIFKGDILFPENEFRTKQYDNSYVVVKNGLVEGIHPELPEKYKNLPVEDYSGCLIIPAFSDLHLHAAQFYQRGVGMDKLLLDWLQDYTFPQESRFREEEYARTAYDLFAKEMIKHGTLQASIFTTVHYDASDYLFQALESKGVSAFVGKVNMDANCPDYIREKTEHSLTETERFIAEHQGGKTVKPILTPRFIPTCTEELMRGLGKLAKKYHAPVQTHLCESIGEIECVRSLFPQYKCDAEVYLNTGLIGDNLSILAHCIYLSPEDLSIVLGNNCVAVHCPDSNMNVIAGIMPASKLLNNGVKIAMGCDIGGGHDLPVYKVMASSIQVSKLRELYLKDCSSITIEQAFHMATKAGGSCFGNIGTFDKGYQFNALVIDDSMIPGFKLSPVQRLERFCYIGDDRNIRERFIRGEKVDFE